MSDNRTAVACLIGIETVAEIEKFYKLRLTDSERLNCIRSIHDECHKAMREAGRLFVLQWLKKKAMAADKTYTALNKILVEGKTCPICGKQIRAKSHHNNKKYCSRKCVKAAYRQRQKHALSVANQ